MSKCCFSHEHVYMLIIKFVSRVTDMKGDIMILNPFIPSVDLSKIAFSYGLGRAAKLTSIEASVKQFLIDIANIPATLCDSNNTKEALNNRSLTGKLLFIQQRMIKGSRDGLLGTPDFHWAKPELESYVNKISTRFDVSTRISILNKQLGNNRKAFVSIYN